MLHKKNIPWVIVVINILFIHSYIYAQEHIKPNLVIGIVVDQMRYDYLQRYWNKFGDEGFKKLVNNGYLCRNTHFNYVPTYTGPGHASIFTGTTPSVHGIISNMIFDRSSASVFYCVNDKNVHPVGTQDSSSMCSPANMYVATIGDQLRFESNYKSKVIGLSLKDRAAILPAGHSANAAYWFDGTTANWVSSTYYMNELPGWVTAFNNEKKVEAYLNKSWTTVLPIKKYTESSADDESWEYPFNGEISPVFPHNLPKLKALNGGFYLIKSTPYGNTLTREFAEAAITGEKLGKGEATDMLTVSFSATDYIGHSFGPNAVETEDTYIRLDKDLALFLEFLDKNIGAGNYLLFLTSDHGVCETPGYLQEHHMPGGYFNAVQMLDQIKAMLIEKFGTADVLLGYNDMQFYLNKELILKKGLDADYIEKQIIDILINIKGVAAAISVKELLSGHYSEGFSSLLQNGIHQKRSGDVVFLLQPGWIIGNGKGTTHGSLYNYDSHVPLIWYGAGIDHGSTDLPVNITDITPTLSRLLNIPSYPDGCSGNQIPYLYK